MSFNTPKKSFLVQVTSRWVAFLPPRNHLRGLAFWPVTSQLTCKVDGNGRWFRINFRVQPAYLFQVKKDDSEIPNGRFVKGQYRIFSPICRHLCWLYFFKTNCIEILRFRASLRNFPPRKRSTKNPLKSHTWMYQEPSKWLESGL